MATVEMKIPARIQIKAILGVNIRDYIESEGLHQGVVAEICNITQPRVSCLVNGKLDLFSIDTLVDICEKLDIQVNVSVNQK